MLILTLTSCHSLIYEDKIIIQAQEPGPKGYKYSYRISAFPTYQILYSNSDYNVGDTIQINK